MRMCGPPNSEFLESRVQVTFRHLEDMEEGKVRGRVSLHLPLKEQPSTATVFPCTCAGASHPASVSL